VLSPERMVVFAITRNFIAFLERPPRLSWDCDDPPAGRDRTLSEEADFGLGFAFLLPALLFFILLRAARICAIILPGAGPAAFAAFLPCAVLLSFTTVFTFFSFFPFWIDARRPLIPPPAFGLLRRGGSAAAATGSTDVSFLNASTSAAEKPPAPILAITAPSGMCILSILANLAYLALPRTLALLPPPPPLRPPSLPSLPTSRLAFSRLGTAAAAGVGRGAARRV